MSQFHGIILHQTHVFSKPAREDRKSFHAYHVKMCNRLSPSQFSHRFSAYYQTDRKATFTCDYVLFSHLPTDCHGQIRTPLFSNTALKSINITKISITSRFWFPCSQATSSLMTPSLQIIEPISKKYSFHVVLDHPAFPHTH